MTTAFSPEDSNVLERTQHPRLRRLVAALFTPRRIEQLSTAVGDIADRYPVPCVCAALGAPREDWPLFSRWADRLTHPTSDGAFRGALYDLYAYVDVLVAARCRNLEDDLLSDLIVAHVDGYEPDSGELRMLVADALMATESTCLGAHLARIANR